jgi:hypothetical protein
LLEKSNLASLALPTFSMSVRVRVELLKASMYFVALFRAILSRLADWLLLKLSATLKCNSCRILFAGIGFWGIETSFLPMDSSVRGASGR